MPPLPSILPHTQEFPLPPNVRATTNAAEAITGAQYAVHAVPVQSSRAFLVGVRDLLPPNVPIICVSKGLEVRGRAAKGGGCSKGLEGERDNTHAPRSR